MGSRAYIVAGVCLLVIAAITFIFQPFKIANPRRVTTESAHITTNEGSHKTTKVADNRIAIRGIGSITYKRKLLNCKTEDLIRIVANRMPPDIAPTEEEIEWRNSEGRWANTNVYFGKDEQILHISLNKGKFQTYPLDDKAIAELQSMQGHAIVKLGYPDELIDSGYTKEDFLAATYDRWDKYHSGNEFEYEITPVVVKITPEYRLSTSENLHLIGKEFPMILVKGGRKFYPSEGTYQTGTFTDAYTHGESIFRSWGLIPYVPIEIDGKMTLPPLGAGVSYKEPLMEAWKKRQAESRNNR